MAVRLWTSFSANCLCLFHKDLFREIRPKMPASLELFLFSFFFFSIISGSISSEGLFKSSFKLSLTEEILRDRPNALQMNAKLWAGYLDFSLFCYRACFSVRVFSTHTYPFTSFFFDFCLSFVLAQIFQTSFHTKISTQLKHLNRDKMSLTCNFCKLFNQSFSFLRFFLFVFMALAFMYYLWFCFLCMLYMCICYCAVLYT